MMSPSLKPASEVNRLISIPILRTRTEPSAKATWKKPVCQPPRVIPPPRPPPDVLSNTQVPLLPVATTLPAALNTWALFGSGQVPKATDNEPPQIHEAGFQPFSEGQGSPVANVPVNSLMKMVLLVPSGTRPRLALTL